MIFNLDVSEKAKEVVFSFKAVTTNDATIYLNNVPVLAENSQKHLSLFVDSKLFFIILIKKFKKPLKVSKSPEK